MSNAQLMEKRRQERLSNEKEQNDLLMEKVRHNPAIMPMVKYGDIIQLEHVRSGKFVGMRKGHSIANENNQTVVLMDEAEEGRGCYFKVLYMHFDHMLYAHMHNRFYVCYHITGVTPI